MTPSLEGWPTKAKEAPFPDEVKTVPGNGGDGNWDNGELLGC